MEWILFSLTVTSTIGIAFTLFVIESNDTITLEIFVASVNLALQLGTTFVCFYLSERITTELLGIDEIFYNSSWYRLLTAKQQQLVVLIIQQAQREIRLTGLGMIECSLPVFSSVNLDVFDETLWV